MRGQHAIMVGLLILVLAGIGVAMWLWRPTPVVAPVRTASTTTTTIATSSSPHSYADQIVVTTPTPDAHIQSPLIIAGKARGPWFFEASFPVVLTDWDGKIIANGHATAQGNWMTGDFVPFTATLHFTSPYHTGDSSFMQRGTLILKKDNPSGIPANDDAYEFPIRFAPAQ